MCKNKVYNSLFVRKALMLVYGKLQDKLSPQTNEKYSLQYQKVSHQIPNNIIA